MPHDTTGSTGDAVTNANFDLSFAQTYNSMPGFFAQLQSYNGGDPVAVRYRQLGLDGSQIFLQEERSADDELGHGFENVGYLVFETGSIFSKIRAPIARSSSINTEIFIDAQMMPPEFDKPLVGVLPETSAYSMVNDDWAIQQVDGAKEDLNLAGAIELSEEKTDAAFAELADDDLALDAEFFDSLDGVFATDN